MADVNNQQVKSKREAFNERLRSRHPDNSFEDEEALFGQISDDYDEYDKNIAGYQEREKAFVDLFNSDPRAAAFMKDWHDGEDPWIGIIRRFGRDEIREAIDDPEKLDALEAANKDYLARVAKSKELDEKYEANLRESDKMLDALQAEKGYTDEQMDAAVALLNKMSNEVVLGMYTAEAIDMALKAINHDADVANANQEGLVQGKNTKIEEKLRKSKGGDGVSALDGSNTPVSQKPRRNLGAIERYGDGNKTIWERGNEKRRREY